MCHTKTTPPQGPGFIFLFHPALGPLWDVISQKLVGGSLAQGSELVLECAEARLVDVDIAGSLQVRGSGEGRGGEGRWGAKMAGRRGRSMGEGGCGSSWGHAPNSIHCAGDEHCLHLTPSPPAVARSAPGAALLQVYAENVMGHLESPADTAAATATALHAALAEDIAQQQQQQQQASVAAAGGAAAAAVAAAAASTAAASSPALTMPFGFGTNASAAAGSPSVSAAGGGILRYGRRCGRVQMVNVRVRNAGIDWASPDNVYWKHQVRVR